MNNEEVRADLTAVLRKMYPDPPDQCAITSQLHQYRTGVGKWANRRDALECAKFKPAHKWWEEDVYWSRELRDFAVKVVHCYLHNALICMYVPLVVLFLHANTCGCA